MIWTHYCACLTGFGYEFEDIKFLARSTRVGFLTVQRMIKQAMNPTSQVLDNVLSTEVYSGLLT